MTTGLHGPSPLGCVRQRRRVPVIDISATDLLQGGGADVEFLHGPRLHRPAGQRVALVTAEMAVLEHQRVLLLLRQGVALCTHAHTHTHTMY